jgi:hypothetical protein
VKVIDSDSFVAYVKDMPKHKKNPDVGVKSTCFSPELFFEFNDAKDLTVGEEVNFWCFYLFIVAHSVIDITCLDHSHGLGKCIH